jgi:F0F1-type ATP synthase assembly protein I
MTMPSTPVTPPPYLDLARVRAKALILAASSVFICVTIFGGGGYLLDLVLDKHPLFFIIGMVVAFLSTNILIILVGKKITHRPRPEI